MKRAESIFIALGLLLLTSFGGVLISSLIVAGTSAQDDSETEEFGEGGFPDEFGGGFEGESGRFGDGFGTFTLGPSEPQQVWCEAIYTQIDTAELDDIRIGGEPFVTPVSERTLLTPVEKLELLHELKLRSSFEIIGAASVVSIDGQCQLVQMVEEIRYPYTHDGALVSNGASGRPHYLADDFECRDTGIRLNWTTNCEPGHDVIGMLVLFEASRLAGWLDMGSGIADQPLMLSWNEMTDLYIRDGMTLVMTGIPLTGFGRSLALDTDQIPESMGSKTAVILISARILALSDAGHKAEEGIEE